MGILNWQNIVGGVVIIGVAIGIFSWINYSVGRFAAWLLTLGFILFISILIWVILEVRTIQDNAPEKKKRK